MRRSILITKASCKVSRLEISWVEYVWERLDQHKLKIIVFWKFSSFSFFKDLGSYSKLFLSLCIHGTKIGAFKFWWKILKEAERREFLYNGNFQLVTFKSDKKSPKNSRMKIIFFYGDNFQLVLIKSLSYVLNSGNFKSWNFARGFRN